MSTTTSVHELIKTALIAGGIAAMDGPAKNLPTKADGTIAQAAVLWPAPRLNTYTRQSGTRSGGTDSVTITCVGATTRDALAVADKVEAAIGGMVLSPKGNPLRQTLVTFPATEPNSNPVRISCAVEYSTITKG